MLNLDAHGRHWWVARSNEITLHAPIEGLFLGFKKHSLSLTLAPITSPTTYTQYEWNDEILKSNHRRHMAFKTKATLPVLLSQIEPQELLCLTVPAGSTVSLRTMFDLITKRPQHRLACYQKFQQLTTGRPYDPFEL
jgi:hypothetical protein